MYNSDNPVSVACKWSADEQSVTELMMTDKDKQVVIITLTEDGSYSYKSKLIGDSKFIEADATFSLESALYNAYINLGIFPPVSALVE